MNDFFILIRSEFFTLLRTSKKRDLPDAYHAFIRQIIDLCRHEQAPDTFIALTCAETELQYMQPADIPDTDYYIRKALAFIRRLLRQFPASPVSGLPDRQSSAGSLRWTGTQAEFVELLYGLQEMKSIADGDMPVNELAESIGRLFGIEMKGAVFYNTYTNLVGQTCHEGSNSPRDTQIANKISLSHSCKASIFLSKVQKFAENRKIATFVNGPASLIQK